MADLQLAQLNIANLAYPLDSPELKDFVDNLDFINSLAERSDGFVWRLQTPAGNATDIDAAMFKHFGDNIIVNMSTWRDAESLKHFVYKTVHARLVVFRIEDLFRSLVDSRRNYSNGGRGTCKATITCEQWSITSGIFHRSDILNRLE